MNPKDTKLPPMQSLTERIFGVRADIAYCLQTPEHQNDEYVKAFHDELKALLREQIVQLPDSHISVRAHWAAVTRYRTPDAWVYLKATDVVELKNEVAPLILKNGEDEKAKKFDLLALYVQLSLLDDTFAAAQYEAKITYVIDALRQRASIPAIKEQLPHLNEFMTSEFWNNKTLASIENMRKVVRELMQYLTGDAGKIFEVDIDDTITVGQDTKPISMSITYRQKVFDFLNQNRDLPVLNKIKNIEQLSSDDIKELERIMWQELGTKQDYLNFLARENLAESCGDSVAAFLRTIIKVDRQKAIELFTKYISENTLNADQEEYLKSILDYVCENGDMKINTLVNEAPFDEINVIELFPGKAQQIAAFIATLHNSITAA
jgi:type I restriction enzyme R subunit